MAGLGARVRPLSTTQGLLIVEAEEVEELAGREEMCQNLSSSVDEYNGLTRTLGDTV